jgi:UDPglucose 6-dehydrogenase
MNVGWVGLGKLGLPCALALESVSEHKIIGYDVDVSVRDDVTNRVPPQRIEDGLEELLKESRLSVVNSVDDVIEAVDDRGIVFVAVPTPHDFRYGGEQSMPEEPADFDYRYLRDVARSVNLAAATQNKKITLAVISTALPGTMRREIMPLLSSFVTLVYNPFFIAMGTTIEDYLDPEFVLLGADDPTVAAELARFYADALGPHVMILSMTPEEAELTKVAYNTFISMKIVFANTLLEISDKLNIDVDVVTNAITHGHMRITSGAYMRGGVGDGGACHPRDNIAMSWLASQLDLSVDPFQFVTRARELQSMWLITQVVDDAAVAKLPIVVLGKAYKPESDLTFGSPAALLVSQMTGYDLDVAAWWDPYVDAGTEPPTGPAVYVVMTKHDVFRHLNFSPGSIVIDPHRFIEDQPGVRVIRLGTSRYL